MLSRSIYFAVLFFCVAVLTGCNTVQDAQAARGSGDTRVYQHPFAPVWDAAVGSVENSNLKLLTANETTGEILAQKGISAFSYGENIAMYVEAATSRDVRPTRVEIISKKSMSTNIFARDWSDTLHEAIAGRLDPVETNP